MTIGNGNCYDAYWRWKLQKLGVIIEEATGEDVLQEEDVRWGRFSDEDDLF